MKFSVKFSPEALRDLDKIYDYISNTLNSPVAADHTVNKILGKTDFLAENPEIGEEKKQDLAGIRVYKYKLNEKLYLLSYSYDPKTLRLIMLGFHENFYRDLKDYLKG